MSLVTARNLERFDRRLADLLVSLHEEDLLIVTADHGNHPTTPTDHSREYVPLLVAGPEVNAGADLGIRHTCADVGRTPAENSDVGPLAHGTSFLDDLRA